MDVGRGLVLLGLLLVALGLLLIYAPWLLNWFGRLPGDIRIERDGFRFYLPLASMLLISLVLSLLLGLLLRWFRGP
jgi:hypothetical protein